MSRPESRIAFFTRIGTFLHANIARATRAGRRAHSTWRSRRDSRVRTNARWGIRSSRPTAIDPHSNSRSNQLNHTETRQSSIFSFTRKKRAKQQTGIRRARIVRPGCGAGQGDGGVGRDLRVETAGLSCQQGHRLTQVILREMQRMSHFIVIHKATKSRVT